MPDNGAVESQSRDVVILGSTGSIGTQALDVVSRSRGLFELVGLSDVLAVFKPAWHQALEAHRVNVVPGTLMNVTRTSDVLIGLLLLMLARGLRRRKRRAWQAVIALLVFDIVIHFLHFPHAIPVSGFVAIALLAVLLYRHQEFYAVADPRNRRTALRVFVALVVMDFAIGLGYLQVGPLSGSYSFFQRLQDVLFELVGVYGPITWANDARGDLYHFLTSGLGVFTWLRSVIGAKPTVFSWSDPLPALSLPVGIGRRRWRKAAGRGGR